MINRLQIQWLFIFRYHN